MLASSYLRGSAWIFSFVTDPGGGFSISDAGIIFQFRINTRHKERSGEQRGRDFSSVAVQIASTGILLLRFPKAKAVAWFVESCCLLP
jgi:hypothetical protein